MTRLLVILATCVVVCLIAFVAIRKYIEASPLKGVFKPGRAVGLGPNENSFYALTDDFSFYDSTGKQWKAPKGTLTDGASIPQAFLSLTGRPDGPTFFNAAVVHDAYCQQENKTGLSFHKAKWEDVHRMFYEAMITAGTDPLKAKLMYAAVYYEGPRWDETGVSLAVVPQDAKVAEFAEVVKWIKEQDKTGQSPSLNTMEDWMTGSRIKLATTWNPRSEGLRSNPINTLQSRTADIMKEFPGTAPAKQAIPPAATQANDK